MNQVLISVETLNRVLGYLGTKPYQEVFQLIDLVQKDAANQTPSVDDAIPPAE
jgi:hypothetical protein